MRKLLNMDPRIASYALIAAVFVLTTMGLGPFSPQHSTWSVAATARAATDNTGDNVLADNISGDNTLADNGVTDNAALDNSSSDNFDDSDNYSSSSGASVSIPVVAVAPPVAPPPDVVSVCAPAGQETVLLSGDGRIAVRAFPTLPHSVRLTLRTDVPLSSVPPTSGLRVGGLLFQVLAETCDGAALPELPAEINLGIRYADYEVGALDEHSLLIAVLDPADGQWKDAPKQAADLAANFISATITATGLYTVYQPL
jgi:hypothetical protein